MDGQAKRKLIVGLDFGTTHTGIKYAMEGDSHVEHIDCWPLANGKTTQAQKNPSLIAYMPQGSATPWGYQINSQENICAWMKYHLDKLATATTHDDPRLTEAIQDGLFRASEEKHSPDRIATDYMKEVLKFSVDFLEKRFHEVDMPGILDITLVEWWIVRPAIWSSQAVMRLQNIVETAAKEAKFYRPWDTFNFVTEADAAAFCVLFEAAAREEVAEEDVVFVCDCGGGTVDVAVYEVPNTMPVKMREVAAGLGGKCGSSCIELEFHNLMEKRFGEAYKNLDPSTTRVRSRFMTKFETYKHAFSGPRGTSDDFGADELDMMIPLDMPDLDMSVEHEYYRKEDRLVVLTSWDMEKIFKPTIDRILGIIKEQYKAAAKKMRRHKVTAASGKVSKHHGLEQKKAPTWRLMMAGGFARSKHLQTKVQEWCRGVDVHFKALEDIDSWGAIAHGAVLHQLDKIQVEKRLSRFHTGIRCGLPYNADADARYQQDKYLCPFYQVDYVANCIYWYSHRGDMVDEHSKKSGEFYVGLTQTQRSFEVEIVTSSAAKEPRHYYRSAQELRELGLTQHDPNAKLVTDVGVLQIQLSSIELQKYRDKTPGQGSVIKFDYIIEETMGSSQGSLMYRAIDALDKQPVGEAEVQLPVLE